MSNLRRIREVNWDEIEALEMKLLREMTVEAGIREYLALRREFEPLLQRADAVYGSDVCSPEDLIVLKMIAFRPQDQIDVERVIERQGDKLDDEIHSWLVEQI